MDIVKLRTLTVKSKLNFGKFSGLFIQQILNLNETAYLRWIYYNISGISFTADILEQIHVFPEMKIKKPGISPEFYEETVKMLMKKVPFLYKSHIEKRMRVKAKHKLSEVNRSVNFSKKVLQAVNHGKIL
jgi:hypothetical protein